MFLVLLLLIVGCAMADQDYEEDDVFKHFCAFDKPMMNHDVSKDDEFCNCDVKTSHPIGKPLVNIHNCAIKASFNHSNFRWKSIANRVITLMD